MPLFHFTPERRERFQRLALATIVVLLATIATNRLVHAVQSPFTGERFAQVQDHATWDDDCTPSRPHIAFEMSESARALAAEARRHAAEARQAAAEQRRMVRDRCEIEREIEREFEHEMAVLVH